MAIQLGPNQYGKAENRIVRVYRDTDRHRIRDLNVSTSLRGRFDDAHITGDQKDVLPTDTQKNTAFAFAKEKGVEAVEDFALVLADHFISRTPGADGARIEIEEYAWNRIPVDGAEHDHAFVRGSSEVRTTVVNMDGYGPDRRTHVVSGLRDLVLFKSTGSEFHGFFEDKYTTLRPTKDRIMATSLVARWRYDHLDVNWDKSFDAIRSILLRQFAAVHSLALQQTLYSMGRAVLEQLPEVAEIKFSAPNKHHFLVDLSPFHVENPGEVFIAADRPYGLIEASVHRDDASDPGAAWFAVPGFC
ncbi:factor-independent urate hydroxylase [Nocardia otitidiscaviarum]|uniref:Uricase n=1 Tax=Nocardia otitidiscaviarum TaxID=1823 RepID=A0A516NNU1_9NOCA|nr:urate oxidase [Nocardia otitidiscaviarum]MBF6181402.1 urate oxidase [Nocardia otitidiscaviarum]MCP9624198.1 urate oxidase [Nocardia otitidiscaviarum]QDP80573.1 urate oxidase [Nocardia otitidiscaviarum]